MIFAAIMFRTAPAILPVILLVLLVLGLTYPVYDFIKLRIKARQDREPLPGVTVLFQELSRSQLLAVFLFITGILSVLVGFIGLNTRDHFDTPIIIKMTTLIALGGVSVFISQSNGPQISDHELS